MTHDHARDVGIASAAIAGLLVDQLAGHAIAVATAMA